MAEIFISHSARKDEALVGVVQALRSALEAVGLEVWLDEARLEAGATWRQEIDEALLRCHGAVVVVSDTALTSDWVLKEASILSARKQVSAGFKLIPAIVPPMTFKRLQRAEKLEPVRLDDYQGVEHHDPGPGVAEIACKLKPLVRRFAVDSPHVMQELLIARLLGSDVDEDELRAAGGLLNLRPEDWALEPRRSRLLARRLLETRIDVLSQAVDKIRYFRPDVAGAVFEAAAPFAWVDWDAASAIAEVAAAPAPPRAVGVNSEQTLTCEMYVRCGAPGLRYGEVTGGFSGERTSAEICEHVRVALSGAFNGPPGDLISDADLKQLLKRFKAVVIVPHPPPDDAALEEVKSTFEDLTLFFAAGSQAAALLSERGLDFVRLLEPELDPATETSALDEYRLVVGLFGGVH